MFRDHLTNQELKDITLKDFRYGMGACESEKVHAAVRELINNLNPESESFETDWKHLVFGGMIVGIVIYSDKYGIDYHYPYQLHTLKRLCQVSSLPDLFACHIDINSDHEAVKLITDVGRLIFEKKLPFTYEQLKRFPINYDTQLISLLGNLMKECGLNDAEVPVINEQPSFVGLFSQPRASHQIENDHSNKKNSCCVCQ